MQFVIRSVCFEHASKNNFSPVFASHHLSRINFVCLFYIHFPIGYFSLSLFLGCRSVAVLPSLLSCLILKARSSNNFFPFDVKYHHRPDKYIKWSRSQQMSQKPSKRNGIMRVHQRGDSQTQKYSSEHLQAEWIVFSFSVIQRLVFFLLVARFGSVENRREYFNVLFSHCGRDNRKKIC